MERVLCVNVNANINSHSWLFFNPPPPPRVLFHFESNSDVNGSVNDACGDVIKRDKQTCVIS